MGYKGLAGGLFLQQCVLLPTFISSLEKILSGVFLYQKNWYLYLWHCSLEIHHYLSSCHTKWYSMCAYERDSEHATILQKCTVKNAKGTQEQNTAQVLGEVG